MTWGRFFSSPEIQCSVVTVSFGLALGMLGSSFLASNLSQECSDLVKALFGNITIPRITGTFEVGAFSIPASFSNVNTPLPENIIENIPSSNKISNNSYFLIFGVGTLLAASFIFSLASYITVLINLHRQLEATHTKNENQDENEDVYQYMSTYA